jgi:hypothetical protein
MSEEIEHENLRPTGKQTDEGVEQEIYHSIMQTDFLEKIEEAEIDIKSLVADKKKDPTQFHKFNYLLKDLHNTNEIDMCSALTYLEDYFDYKDLFKCLNAENLILVKSLMAAKFNIKKKR